MDCPNGFDLEKFDRVLQGANSAIQIEETIAGPTAQRYIKNYNAQPPASDYVGTQVTVWFKPGASSVLIGIIDREGCLVVWDEIPLPEHNKHKGSPKSS